MSHRSRLLAGCMAVASALSGLVGGVAVSHLPGAFAPYHDYAWLLFGLSVVSIFILAIIPPGQEPGTGTGRSTRDHYGTSLARVQRRIEEARRGSLRELARIELDLADLADEPALRPEVLLRRKGRESRPLAGGIVEAWRESQHALLLLGAPGAGKTTMLLELATELAGTALRGLSGDADMPPLPVLIDLADWRPRRIGWRPRPRLRPRLFRRSWSPNVDAAQERDPAGWLVSWLRLEYQIRPGVAHQWLRDDKLALLFDGLDEVPEQHRAACITWLNNLCREYPTVPIAVVSRTSEFAWLRRPLTLNGVAEIQPLTRQKVETYLRSAGPAAAPVRAALASDESLWEVFDAPIWLVIMTLTLRDAGGTATEGSVEGGRKRLLDGFVAAAVQRPRPADRYTPDQTVRWLAQLARFSRWDLRLRRVFIKPPDMYATAESWTAAAVVAANTIAAGALTLPLLRSYGLIVTVAAGCIPLAVLLIGGFLAPRRPVFSPFAGLALGWLIVHFELRLTHVFREWLSAVPVSWIMHFSAADGSGAGGEDYDLHKWITENQFRDLMAIFFPGVLVVVIALAFTRIDDLNEAAPSVTSILCPVITVTPFIVAMVEGARVAAPFQGYYYGLEGSVIVVLLASAAIAFPFRGLRVILESLSSDVGSMLRALQSFGWHLARGRVPLRLQRFLRQGADHGLLIHGQGGYRFPHALFRDYFASLDPAIAVAPRTPANEPPVPGRIDSAGS